MCRVPENQTRSLFNSLNSKNISNSTHPEPEKMQSRLKTLWILLSQNYPYFFGGKLSNNHTCIWARFRVNIAKNFSVPQGQRLEKKFAIFTQKMAFFTPKANLKPARNLTIATQTCNKNPVPYPSRTRKKFQNANRTRLLPTRHITKLIYLIS